MKASGKILSLLVLGFAALLSSCSKVPDSAKLIPEDATVVMRLDVRQIAESSGLTDDGALKADLKKRLKDADFSRAFSEKLEHLLDDPAKAGLDLRDPVFVYFVQAKKDTPALDMEPQETVGDSLETDADMLGDVPPYAAVDDVGVGIVGTVYSAKDLAEFLNALAKETGDEPLTEKDGLYYSLSNGTLFVFNKDYFCVSHADYAGKSESEVLADARKLLDEGVEHSMYDNDFFKTMCKKEGEMQLLFYNALAGSPEMQMMESMIMPEGVKVKDMAYVMDVHMEKGETKAQIDILTKSDECDALIKKGDQVIDEIKGDLLKYVPKDGFSVFCNIHGDKLYEMLQEFPLFKQLPKDMTAQIKKVLSAIDGDFAFTMSDLDEKGTMPRFSVYAQTKDATLISMLKELNMVTADMKEKASNCYVLPVDEKTTDVLNLGWKNNTTYFTMGAEGDEFTEAKAPLSANVMKGRQAYVYFDFNMLDRLTKGLGETPVSVEMKEIARMFDYAEGYDEGMRKNIITLKHKDKSKTLLELVYTYAMQMMDRQQNSVMLEEDLKEALKETGV